MTYFINKSYEVTTSDVGAIEQASPSEFYYLLNLENKVLGFGKLDTMISTKKVNTKIIPKKYYDMFIKERSLKVESPSYEAPKISPKNNTKSVKLYDSGLGLTYKYKSPNQK